MSSIASKSTNSGSGPSIAILIGGGGSTDTLFPTPPPNKKKILYELIKTLVHVYMYINCAVSPDAIHTHVKTYMMRKGMPFMHYAAPELSRTYMIHTCTRTYMHVHACM